MKLGIPYMGSKRKLASEILKVITQRHEGISNFYDLFGLFWNGKGEANKHTLF